MLNNSRYYFYVHSKLATEYTLVFNIFLHFIIKNNKFVWLNLSKDLNDYTFHYYICKGGCYLLSN